MFAHLTVNSFDLQFDKDLPYTVTKTFRLFSSFPLNDTLKQGVIVAKDGACFRLIGEHSLFPKKRKEVNVPFNDGLLDFDAMGFMMAEVLDLAPSKVIQEMFT